MVSRSVTDRRDESFSEWGSRLALSPVSVRLVLSLLLLSLTAAVDYVTGSEISCSVFYVAPVAFAGALVSRRAGAALAVASAVLWTYFEITTGRGFSAAWIPYWNGGVRLAFFLIINELMGRLRRAHMRERELARTDALTGIANARVFEEHVDRAMAQSRRSARAFTVAYIDLDRFKAVNDEYGHAEGDRVLRTVSALIRDAARATDVVARLGGDEFGILMPDTDAEQGRVPLERIGAAIGADAGSRWGVGATIGAVTFGEPPETADYAVRQADALMFRGKAEGRGSILQATWPGVEEA